MARLAYGYIDGIEAAVRRYPLEGVKKDEVERAAPFDLALDTSTLPTLPGAANEPGA